MVSTNGKRIMVVDDEPDIITVLSEYLAGEGFQVITAPNGQQAIKQAEETYFDLILLDIAMPVMNGLDVLKEIKKIKPDTAVIMITAYRDAEKVVECFRTGAFDCIFKPFDLKYLRNAILAKLMC
ncbi:MAG: response regulator [Elusimicrobiota bacterium]